MMNRRWLRLGIFPFLGSLLLSIVLMAPAQGHWADLAVADIAVSDRTAHMNLTFPTGLAAFADSDRNGQLSPEEVRTHQNALQEFFGDRIRLINRENINATVTVEPAATTTLPPDLQATAATHSSVHLIYTWPQSVQELKLNYNLFLSGVPTAHCLVTTSYQGKTQSAILRPQNRELALMQTSPWYLTGSVPLAIAACFIWGAMHAMSPGHGKTIVGAYLVGSHATAQHAVFLGLTTTITHTAGVFALGIVTLFLSNFVLPDRLYPWLSLLSGLIVIDIGLRLLMNRLRIHQQLKTASHHPVHSHSHHQEQTLQHPVLSHAHDQAQLLHHHHHDHSQDKHHHHHHLGHSHHHGDHEHHDVGHSHLPPGADGSVVTWHNLLALGISGGLVPCPSALVVLLSTIAIGQAGLGLMLVLAFSLGLAGTLTALGLLLIKTRRVFEQVPTQLRLTKVLPTLSALLITLLGLGIVAQAIMQITPSL